MVIPVSMYDFSARRADLENKYSQENAAQDFGRMLGQQRYSRQRDLMNTSYQRGFPKFTGQWARRLGSGVQSGVMRESLTNNVNDYLRGLGELDTAQAQQEAQFVSGRAGREAAYRRMLLALQEDFDRQRQSQTGLGGV